MIYEKWWHEGKQHREGGPAFLQRDSVTGGPSCEIWLRGGELHRENGPAHIDRNPKTGKITNEAWWRDNQRVQTPRSQPLPGLRHDYPPPRHEAVIARFAPLIDTATNSPSP